jgi:hypothetical protein
VICVDNFFTGSKQNIEHLRDEPRFEVVRHDVTFPLYMEVDEIMNLACPASPIHGKSCSEPGVHHGQDRPRSPLHQHHPHPGD